MLDADGSMDPHEIETFVDALASGADLAKGSRFLPGGGTVDMTPVRRLGNRALLAMVNVLYRSRFSELCYGYMAIRRSAVVALELKATGFEIETEIVVRSLLASLRVVEVPSFEAERRFGASNLSATRDGLRVMRTLMRERFSRVRTMSSSSRAFSDVPAGGRVEARNGSPVFVEAVAQASYLDDLAHDSSGDRRPID
jgi:hypothetical protein